MTFDEQYAALWALCAALQIPHAPSASSEERGAWDGRKLNGMRLHGDRIDLWLLWHDLAHWLCAWPSHCRWPGFGMGCGFGGPKVSKVSERVVSAVGVLLHHRHDPPRAVSACGKLRVSEDPAVLRLELATVPGRRAVRLLDAVGVQL
jgi:hypothetical protein